MGREKWSKEKSGARNVRCDKSGGETKVRRAKSGARKVGHR